MLWDLVWIISVLIPVAVLGDYLYYRRYLGSRRRKGRASWSTKGLVAHKRVRWTG
jgi:hypothetical protein